MGPFIEENLLSLVVFFPLASALALANPPMVSGATAASVPPASITSASPFLMRRKASPMA